jgi:MFS family permease
MATESSEARRDPRAPFRYREYRLFQGSRLLSTLAGQMQSVALGWHVYEQMHRPLALGLVGLAQFLPALGFALISGQVADRFDRRRVLLVCHGVQGLSCALLCGLAATSHTAAWPMYAAAALVGAGRAFSGPAAQALLPNLIPREHFNSAVAWSSSVWQLATIVGPAVGGLVLAAASNRASAVYAAAVGLYGVDLLLLAKLRVRYDRLETKAVSWSTLFAGVRYVWQKKVVLGAISLDLFAVLLGGAVALLPIFARDLLHVGAWGMGLLRSAPAVGAGLTAVALAYRPIGGRAGLKMLGCVGLFGAATIVFGLSRHFVLSLAALAVVGAADMVSVVVRQTLTQLTTPSEMRGRVSAVNLVFVGASNELGEFESGLAASWLGAPMSVVMGGVGTCVVVLLWSVLFRELRRVDRLDKLAP